jgi:hypothetical protein
MPVFIGTLDWSLFQNHILSIPQSFDNIYFIIIPIYGYHLAGAWKADHSLPSNAEVKKNVAMPPHPHTS